MNKYTGIIVLGLLGLVSGYVSAIFSNDHSFLGWMPGILFGLIIAIYFCYLQKDDFIFKIIGITSISVVAYYCAVYVTVHTFNVGGIDSALTGINLPAWGAFFVGGATGTLILSVGINYFSAQFSYLAIAPVTIVGGILGALASTFDPLVQNGMPLFMIWQTGMALAYGTTTITRNDSVSVPMNFSLVKKVLAFAALGLAVYLMFFLKG